MQVAPSAGGTTFYGDPLRNARVTPERIDMGVDYQGRGAIYALGDGVITESDNAWSGAEGAPFPGTFITERLTSGPLAGKYVYLAEDVTPNVRTGQRVTANSVLGYFTGSGQIETGYAVGPNMPGTTLAMAKGQSASGSDPGAFPTAYGEAYNNVLTSTGAPSGVLSGTPAGTLPKNWPLATGISTSSAQDTSSSSGYVSLGGWGPFHLTIPVDVLERFGMILLGGVLAIVGIWVLFGKQALELTAK